MSETKSYGFFPEIEPNKEYQIPCGGLHKIYVEESGNPNGQPVIFLHGGPGSGCADWQKGLFDNKVYRVIFLDPLNLNQFINHLGTSSVLLDPIYFGSGNSFHESMFYGTQTVTYPTKYIKSRIVSAAYIQMEIENPPIVKDKDDYVSKAIEIANDKNILSRKKYYQQAANEKLFNTVDVGENFNSILKKLF